MQTIPESYKPLLDSLQTSVQADLIVNELDLLHDAAFRIGERSIEQALHSQIRITTKLLLEEIFVKEAISLNNTEQVISLFSSIKRTIQDCPRLDMTIAFEPTEELIASIHSFILENMLGEHVLISIHTNPGLIAGLSLTFEGKYRDYSLAKQFQFAIQKVMNQPQP